MKVSGKKVVIVGGSSGFGLEVARQALAGGAEIVLGARKAEQLARAAETLASARVHTAVVDATREESLQAFWQQTGEFDHLVSTVGGAMGGGFLAADFALIRSTVEGKIFDNLRVARTAQSFMRAAGSMTFTAGTGGRPQNASGAILGNQGILTMVQGLAAELAPKIRVNAVAPTWTLTPFWAAMPEEQKKATEKHFNSIIPLGRTAHIEEVASAYLFLMENDFITGQQIAVDGGIGLV